MPRIGIELNNVCNLDCTHCFRGIYRGGVENNKDLFLPMELLDKILGEAKTFGYNHVGFTGGEPPLHPRFGESLDLVAKHGMTCHFLTNSRGFEKTLKTILSKPARKAVVKSISFSLDGATEATHDRIRGKGSFREVVSAIAAAQAIGIEPAILTTINRVNRHEIDQLALLGAHLRAVRQLFSHLTPTEHNLDDELLLPLSEWRAVERDVARVSNEFRHQISMAMGFYTEYYLPRCAPLTLEDLNVDYKGRLTLCCQLSNYRDQQGDGEDVVADLKQVSLAEALPRLMDLISKVHKERVVMAADPQQKDKLHYPCLLCVERFSKTTEEPMMVQLTGLREKQVAVAS